MSYLTEILTAQNDVEIVDFKNQLPRITDQISTVKTKVTEYLQNVYVELEPITGEDEILLRKCEELSNQIENMINRGNTISESGTEDALLEINNLKMKILEYKYGFDMCNQLLTAHKKYQQFEEDLAKKNYENAADLLIELQKLTDNELESEPDLYLEIYESFNEQLSTAHSRLLEAAMVVISSSLQINHLNTDNASLTVQVDSSKLQSAILVLYKINSNCEWFTYISNFVLNDLFKSIVEKSCIVSVNEELVAKLIVTVKSDAKPNYSDVIKNLTFVFEFFHVYLHFELDKNYRFLELLSDKIGNEFCQTLIDSCFTPLLPTSPAERRDFRVTEDDIINFRSMLVNEYFFKNCYEPITKFLEGVDTEYNERFGARLVKKAEIIIKKDLHILTEVSSSNDDDNSEFKFSKCQVSNNVIELLGHVNEIVILMETPDSSESTVKHLMITVKNIFTLYYVLVPEYHKKMLETIPQQVAIFYNNCMYLAYKLILLQEKHFEKLPKSVVDLISFTDILCGLRSTANDKLKDQLNFQKKLLLDIVKDSGLSSLGQASELNTNIEKHIRQCLRQLEVLQTVWMKVLPADVYNKSIGRLLNALVEDLINRVLRVEDISATAATQLVAFYTLVKQRAPKVFTDPKEIYQHVRSWMKLSELIFLLEANLVAIDSRWTDGKGPLALAFQPEELKRLIRALFQNTDRRAALLNKIK